MYVWVDLLQSEYLGLFFCKSIYLFILRFTKYIDGFIKYMKVKLFAARGLMEVIVKYPDGNSISIETNGKLN